jgi:cell division protease FtsH
MSDETASIVDSEVRRIVEQGYAKAKKILTENIDDLHKVAKALMEYELLSGDEIKDILAGRPVIRDADDGPSDKPSSPSVPTTGGLPQGV